MQNELHDPILFAKYFIRISFLIFFIFIKKLLETNISERFLFSS